MPYLQTNSIRLYYETHGSGRPLVLIAGIGYDQWMWRKMIPGLAEHYQVIAFDNRGSGRSDSPPGPYSAQLLAADTAGLIEGLGLPRASVMGHSMGGFIAQALALGRPDLLDKLVLSATNFGGPRHIPVTPQAMAVLMDVSGDPAERFRRGLAVSTAPGFGEAHPQVIQEWLDYRTANPVQPVPYQAQLAIGLGLLPAEASFDGRLKDIQAPTLVLFGEYDQVVPPGNAALLAGQLPHATVRILPDAGHFFPLETPAVAVAALVEFLGP